MSINRSLMHADALGPFKTVYLALLESIHKTFGIDPVLIVEGAVGLTAVATFFRYTGGYAFQYLQQFFISSVQIQQDDQLYGQVMRWMTDKQLSVRNSRSVQATTRNTQDFMPMHGRHPRYPPLPLQDDIDDNAAIAVAEDFDPEKPISYRNIIRRFPIHLQPFQVSHYFRHSGAWIRFSQNNISLGTTSPYYPDNRQQANIRLECLGRSLVPIEQLLTDVQTYDLENSKSVTTVFRALGPHGLQWLQVVSRPSRDILTVILNKAKKHALLKDINEYLHPRTRRWYANHGIPYRRGYLFSGAPGTGKTSLTSAIAGIFGLNIYVLSLSDPAMNESELNTLMSNVPARCILLLEDIDAAGLAKRTELATKSKSNSKKSRRQDDRFYLTHSNQRFWGDSSPDGYFGQKSGVSLSALLNAIDGVASHEGRILIMTTNSPEKLDKALIRPGRVDLHIHFELPSRIEVEELFVSMYTDELGKPTAPQQQSPSKEQKAIEEAPGASVKTIAASPSVNNPPSLPDPKSPPQRDPVTKERLQQLAHLFSDAVPEGQLNLADIQGFVLQFKQDPEEACATVAQWVQEKMRADEAEAAEAEKKERERGEKAAAAAAAADGEGKRDVAEVNGEKGGKVSGSGPDSDGGGRNGEGGSDDD